MKNKILFTFCVTIAFSSCLKDDIGTSHENTFQYIWDEMDQNYGGFGPRNIDWYAIYQTYYPQVQSSTTDRELWEVCTDMLDLLDDLHVVMYSSDLDEGYSSNTEFDEDLVEREFELDIVKDNYIEDFTTVLADEKDFVYGMIRGKNIGYIFIPNFEFNDSNWHEKIDDAIRFLQNTDGLILDVRNNDGGAPIIDRFMAARFVGEEKLAFTIQTRNGPNHDDFDAPTEYYSKPAGPLQYTNPTIALTNHAAVSAGEEFLLFLENQSHITVMGDTTSNAFSSVAFNRLLPNGWEFGYPNQLYLYPDGSSPEGIGIVPDIYIRNDSLDVQNGIDKILEQAIEML